MIDAYAGQGYEDHRMANAQRSRWISTAGEEALKLSFWPWLNATSAAGYRICLKPVLSGSHHEYSFEKEAAQPRIE